MRAKERERERECLCGDGAVAVCVVRTKYGMYELKWIARKGDLQLNMVFLPDFIIDHGHTLSLSLSHTHTHTNLPQCTLHDSVHVSKVGEREERGAIATKHRKGIPNSVSQGSLEGRRGREGGRERGKWEREGKERERVRE